MAELKSIRFWCKLSGYYLTIGECLSRQKKAEEMNGRDNLLSVKRCLKCTQGELYRKITKESGIVTP